MSKRTHLRVRPKKSSITWASVERKKDLVIVRMSCKPIRVKARPIQATTPPDCESALW
ncbi:MAG TPA: hypothetical protein VFI72_16915 [Candidatus Angelobacter sp.]|nr:hypothetical protein [Candidatus Angelobacter sp.]